MKIQTHEAPKAAGAAKVGTDEKVTKAAAPQPVERVSTEQSQQVERAIAQAIDGLPADRAAIVAEIAQAVREGRYQPNAKQIAERIVESAQLEARLAAML